MITFSGNLIATIYLCYHTTGLTVLHANAISEFIVTIVDTSIISTRPISMSRWTEVTQHSTCL